MEVEAGVNKLEKLVYPASALVTFFGSDIQHLFAGDFEGLIQEEAAYLRTWHPPTVQGVFNAIGHGPLGSGAVLTLVGWGIEEAGKLLGSGTVDRLGGVVYDGGKGVMMAGLADMIVRPTKYNPHAQGQSTAPMSDPVMRKSAYYERGGKQVANAAIGFR